MSYDHCPSCGSSDIEEICRTSWNSSLCRCEDCGREFEIDNDMYGYDPSWGWQDAVDEE